MNLKISLSLIEIKALADLGVPKFINQWNRIVKYGKLIRAELRNINPDNMDSSMRSECDKLLSMEKKFKDKNVEWLVEEIFGHKGLNRLTTVYNAATNVHYALERGYIDTADDKCINEIKELIPKLRNFCESQLEDIQQ